MAGTLNAVAISGNYTDLGGKPTIGTQLTPDTGWTANAGAGSKTTSIANYSSGGITGTMVTALNTVSAGIGTQLQTMDVQVAALTAKIAALETALATGKLPNA